MTSAATDGETKKESNLYEALGQVSSTDAGQIFRDHLSGCVRQMICEVMAAEVEGLCGAKHQPSDGDHFRAGSSAGRVIFEGEQESLNAPNTLHRSLLSTNAIENSFRNTRNKLGRVTRFRAETDQATKWMSFALLEVEKGFRRISGYADLPELISALEAKRAS